MSVMTMVKAINSALDIKLNEDKHIVIYGEDVGVEGGVFRVTEGLQRNMVWSVSSTPRWRSPLLWVRRWGWLFPA